MVEALEKKPPSKVVRVCRKLLYVSYFLGIAWTVSHPIISVLTGEMKCRGWYLDEHSIEIKFVNSAFQVPAHLKTALPSKPQSQSSLCPTQQWEEVINLQCYEHGGLFSMAIITPLSGALDPVEEAIVFLVPAPSQGDWTTSTFHHSIMTSLEHLANPTKTPWLAKTLILVAPISQHHSLEDTTKVFLDAYMGSPEKNGSQQQQTSIPSLPPRLSGAILRNLVVLQVDDQSIKSNSANRRGLPNGKTEFGILPHGRRGVLPNADLVFLVGKLFHGAIFASTRRYPESTFLAHDYVNETRSISRFLTEHKDVLESLGPKTRTWLQHLADMLLFAYTMAQGPYPPHAPALDRGIDAITIKAKFEGNYLRDPAVEMVQYFEYMVRSLANLEERLHHSFTLYLLPSPAMFVSHMEYFLPNILILLPLAIRSFSLVLVDMSDHLHLKAIGSNLLLVSAATGVSALMLHLIGGDDPTLNNSWFLGFYTFLLVMWKVMVVSGLQRTPASKERLLDTLQFVGCVVAAYILAPIAFAHTSLSYLPSMLFVPLFAFARYSQMSTMTKLLALVVVLVIAPPVLLVPRIFNTFTTFVQFGYAPLHLELLLLTCTSFLL